MFLNFALFQYLWFLAKLHIFVLTAANWIGKDVRSGIYRFRLLGVVWLEFCYLGSGVECGLCFWQPGASRGLGTEQMGVGNGKGRVFIFSFLPLLCKNKGDLEFGGELELLGYHLITQLATSKISTNTSTTINKHISRIFLLKWLVIN